MSEPSIAAIVAAHIEPDTRFDGADLKLVEEERHYSVPLELRVTQTVLHSTANTTGAGRLPMGIVDCGNASAFGSRLQSALEAAQEATPRALQGWTDLEPGSYRRLLPGNAPVGFEPRVYGFEHVCGDCRGHRALTCPGCGGDGRLRCVTCHGQGRLPCTRCHGRQRVECSSCRGRGQWTEQESRNRWDHARNMYVTDYVQVDRTCPSCGGARERHCDSCVSGKVDCTWCMAGFQDCGTCGASGELPCRPCAATGMRHMQGHVQSEVMHGEALTVDTQEERLRQLVLDKLAVDDLPGLGALLEVRHETKGATLITDYHLRLDVRRAVIEASQRRFEIHGFGPALVVPDFCNIAGHLLEGDLRVLQEQLATGAGWRRSRSKALLQALGDFLRSEMNIKIAERVAACKGGAAAASREVAAELQGLVDAAYVQAATEALRSALKRVYGAELTESAAYLCGLTALAAGGMAAIGAPTFGPGAPLAWSVAAASGTWLVLEQISRRRIAAHFPGDLGSRLLGQLAAGGGVQRWRVGMLAGLGVSAVAGMGIVRQLPRVHGADADEALIAEWDRQPIADFQQRSYPPAALLRARAQGGDVRAQEILAWQLLLGAGGSTKDVAEAARWIEQARPAGSTRPLWQAAHALLVLNQEALPAAIRKAARDFDALGEQMGEARYWDARVHLNPKSPVHDLRAGLAKLAQAAHQGHARAALALGQRYAAGDGVPRDPIRARQFLGQANRAGMRDAAVELGKLP